MAHTQEFNLKHQVARTSFTRELNVNHTVWALAEHPQRGSCSLHHQACATPITCHTALIWLITHTARHRLHWGLHRAGNTHKLVTERHFQEVSLGFFLGSRVQLLNCVALNNSQFICKNNSFNAWNTLMINLHVLFIWCFSSLSLYFASFDSKYLQKLAPITQYVRLIKISLLWRWRSI